MMFLVALHPLRLLAFVAGVITCTAHGVGDAATYQSMMVEDLFGFFFGFFGYWGSGCHGLWIKIEFPVLQCLFMQKCCARTVYCPLRDLYSTLPITCAINTSMPRETERHVSQSETSNV